MKKQILNLGKPLNKSEQQFINGGRDPQCCGGTGGMEIDSLHCEYGLFGTDYCNGKCFWCY
ncbi:hypothetical protein P8625_06840 [Tenacibaculum tangerinum]|uniref:Bacteriocin n=1 Tax=Tenacibaculum tangerinum TaxID=3038772 RepID=A0ABY8L646_9FLAO|nr:hypothetical protein [Tenacibaculum tangerinum]WGH76852.1 hypothetical protein P8625_06840 [Tenacibaculum tangerinum]